MARNHHRSSTHRLSFHPSVCLFIFPFDIPKNIMDLLKHLSMFNCINNILDNTFFLYRIKAWSSLFTINKADFTFHYFHYFNKLRLVWTTSPSPHSEEITAFNISVFLLSIISNTPWVQQSNKVLSYVFSCSSGASNIQRKSLQHSWPITCISKNHQTLPAGALETYAYCRCCHMGLM